MLNIRQHTNGHKMINIEKITPVICICRPVEIGLRLTGIWPGSLHGILLRVVWVIVMGLTQVFQYRYIITHFSLNSLSDLIDGVSTTLPYSLLFVKLIIFWINRRIFYKILLTLSEDWMDSTVNDFNMNCIIYKAALSQRYSKLIISVYAAATFLYSGTSFQYFRNKEIEAQPRQLLIKMELPFPSIQSPIYECVFFVQFVQLVIVGTTIGVLNSLMITLMLHVGGQIDIIRQALKDFCAKDAESKLWYGSMADIIKKHYRIIALTENMQKLYTYIALMQFLCDTFIICCIGFLIVASFGTSQRLKVLIKMLFFYIAMTLEAFVFCFAGEYLSTKSQMVSNAAYESLWYLLKPSDRRAVLLFILRSQKRLTLTTGNLVDLSLESFTSILKTSASYISILRALY